MTDAKRKIREILIKGTLSRQQLERYPKSLREKILKMKIDSPEWNRLINVTYHSGPLRTIIEEEARKRALEHY